jgi:hypothetical protein
VRFGHGDGVEADPLAFGQPMDRDREIGVHEGVTSGLDNTATPLAESARIINR